MMFIDALLSSLCSCGMREGAYHFFFLCKNYTNARYKFMHTCIFDLIIIDTHFLFCGDTALLTELNICIFSCVQMYIQETRRFICRY